MGTSSSCVGKQGGGFCASRGFPQFVAPNTDHVTYEFDFSASQGEIQLQQGNEGLLSPMGFVLRSSESVRGAPRWKMVKECRSRAADLRLNLSGRFFVNLPEAPRDPSAELMTSPRRGTCIFKVCTRGRPIYESVRTKTFTHTAHTVTSGVFYSLFVEQLPDGLYLSPRLLLVLKSGDEVPLVEDKLGPLRAPLAFYVDFSILDDGGRNTQMDIIFRVLPDASATQSSSSGSIGGPPALSPPGGLRTLRTCLQEYTTYNSQVTVPHIAMGDSELRTLMASGAVYLQNLVVSEVLAPGATPPAPSPSAAPSPASAVTATAPTPALASQQPPQGDAQAASLADAAGGGVNGASAAGSVADVSALTSYRTPGAEVLESRGEASLVLFEGPSARVPVGALSVAAVAAPAVAASAAAAPQMSGADAAGGMALQAPRSPADGVAPARMAALLSGAVEDEVDSFWYHVRYRSELTPRGRGRRNQSLECDFTAPLKGEFWLTKEAVDKKNVYFHCSSTLFQAITMCTIFRFSCPTDYLSLIENQASDLLKDLHIPTNGVVLGVEEDPRHRGLYRIFVEHRNDILDDMVVCEATTNELSEIAAHQEVYDSGDFISYRLTLVYPDGSRQEASLQLATEKIEVDDQLAEEPSLRFPISPCVSRQLLSPANRVFVYTSVAAVRPDDLVAEENVVREDEEFKTPGTAGRQPIDMWGNTSDGTAEEWQSVGGGFSDGEDNPARATMSAENAAAGQDDKEEAKTWQRLAVESMLLISKLEEAPFKCPSGA